MRKLSAFESPTIHSAPIGQGNTVSCEAKPDRFLVGLNPSPIGSGFEIVKPTALLAGFCAPQPSVFRMIQEGPECRCYRSEPCALHPAIAERQDLREDTCQVRAEFVTFFGPDLNTLGCGGFLSP